jgi:hypothetical protein
LSEAEKRKKRHHFVDGEPPTETQVPFLWWRSIKGHTFTMSSPSSITKEEKHPTPKTWKEWKPMICRGGMIPAREAGKFHKFVRKNPEKIRSYKNTLLWVVGRSAPIPLLQSILGADPEALTRKDVFPIQGENHRVTPLGVACRTNARPIVIRFLIDVRVTLERQASTEAAESLSPVCKKRRCTVPFYPFATTGYDEPDFSPAHMKILLEECPEGVFLNHALNEKPLLNLLLSREDKSGDTYWENVNLVMMAATFGTVRQDELHGRQFVLLHALLQMYCSVGPFQGRQHAYSIEFIIDFMEYIFEREPRQFRMRNHQGHLPIHIVMQNVDIIVGSRAHVNELWTFLLEEYPESAGIADNRGRLALEVAIENGLSCIDELVGAEPRAVETRSMVSYMYPFEQVALALATRGIHGQLPRDYVETEALTVIYKLLRMAPHVARNAIREPWVDTPEYKEFLANQLKMAQIDLLSKLQMAQIDARNEELKKRFKRVQR